MTELLLSARSSAAERVRGALDYHLEHRGHSRLGVGPDPYHGSAIAHPMALALYAHGLVHLHVATGEGRYAEAAIDTADRLIATGRRYGKGQAWGLGFTWRDVAADESFAITTAIACRALVAVDGALGYTPARLALTRAAHWLVHDLPWRIGAGAAPWYAPSVPHTLPNVAAMVSSSLRRAAAVTGGSVLVEAADAAAGFVACRQHKAGLWRYGYAGTSIRGLVRPPDIVDALHMGYTLEGPLDAVEGSERATYAASVRAALRFVDRAFVDRNGRLTERLMLANRNDSVVNELLRTQQVSSRPIEDGACLLVFRDESRVAGYGALISALSRALAHGLGNPRVLERLVTRVLVVHAADISGRFRYLAHDSAAYPRQEAHLFEGLAAYVRAQVRSPHDGRLSKI